MSRERVWVCDFCEAEFNTKEQVDRHEAHCKRRPIRIKGKIKPVIDVWQGIKLGFGFGIGLALVTIVAYIILAILGISFIRWLL